MADNVDGLVIEIESSSGSATSQIYALNASLATLKRTVGSSTPIKTFSKNYAELVNTINTTQIDTVKLEAVRAFGQILNGLNSVRVSGTVGKNLTALNSAVNGLNVEGLANVTQYASTLSQLGEIKISSTLPKRLQELASFASQIQGKNFSSLKEFTSSLAQLAPLTNSSSASIKTFTNSMKSLSENTQKAASRGRTFNTVLANIRVKTLMVVRAVQMITRSVTKSLSVYGDYIETLNLFKMAMGDAGQEAYEFAEKCQDLLGIDLTQWMKAQGVFNSLAVGFGVASDRASIMSQNLTQLAYDISSFYNISVESAIEKVRSGFSGQIRPVRDLGYDLSQARLEAIALSLGIDKSVKSMTQAEKSQLRYIALMTQLTHVQGDLARTLDSPTNQLRILNAQLDQMYRSIGLTLLPILNKVLPYLNAVLRVIKMIANEIAAMFGYTLPKITEEASLGQVGLDVEDLTDDLDEATGSAEKLKNTLASFDQINLITSKSGGSGSGSGDISSIGGMDFDLPTYDFLGDATENKAQEIAEGMMKKIRPFVEFLKDSIKWVRDNIDTISQLLTILATITIGKTLLNELLSVFGVAEKLSKYVSGLSFIVVGFQLSYLGGQDIAKGDWLKGILKSTVGMAASAIGGGIMFGPAGVAIGLALSLTFTLAGYIDEKSKQKMKELENDFFSSFSEYKTSVEDFEKSWEHFLEDFNKAEIKEKQNVADSLGEKVSNIGQSVSELQMQYIAGNISGANYASNLELLYGQMETSVKSHLDAVGQAITEYLNGPFGKYLIAHDYNVQEIEETVAETTQSIIDQISQNKIALQELNEKLKEGTISYDEYAEAADELLEPLKKYGDIAGVNTQATSDFLESFSNLAIDFSDWDQVYATLETVKQGYDDATLSIDEDVRKIKADFALLRDASETEEMKQYYQSLIDAADDWGREQKIVLNSAYQDILESFEQTGTVNWEGLVNKDGLEDALEFAREKMTDFDEKLDEVYGAAGLDRNKTYWTELMGLINGYGNTVVDNYNLEKDLADSTSNSLKGFKSSFQDFTQQENLMTKSRKNALDEYRSKFEEFSDKYKLYLFEQKKETRGLSEAEETAFKKLREQYGLTEEAVKEMSKATTKNFDTIVESVSVGMQSATIEVEAKTRMIGDMIIREDWCVDPMYKAMWDTADVLKQNGITSKFSQNATALVGGVAGQIKNSKSDMQNAYVYALTPATNSVVNIGLTMGNLIKQGMVDNTGAVKEGATALTKGMADAFNTFGDKAYRYFADLANLGAVVLGGMGATVSDSTFNNKFKAPKIKGYATGGFPDSADFFYANENGVPEYVGSIGGRTAVATNTDIVKGVSDGVYRAIKDTGIQNDVKKIASKSAKVVFAPSEEAGKVITQSVNMYSGAGGRY